MSGLPMASSMLPALSVVFSNEAFPWIVVMPSKFREGWWAASKIANASWTVSVSRLFVSTWTRKISLHRGLKKSVSFFFPFERMHIEPTRITIKPQWKAGRAFWICQHPGGVLLGVEMMLMSRWSTMGPSPRIPISPLSIDALCPTFQIWRLQIVNAVTATTAFAIQPQRVEALEPCGLCRFD